MIENDIKNINILKSPKHFYEELKLKILSSTKRIYMTALYLENDEAGREILDLLYKQKERYPDLDVSIFVDFHRAQRGLVGADNQDGNFEYYVKLRKESKNPIDIYGVPVKGVEAFGVLHVKGFVFDDTVIYSGASINNIYLNKFDRYRIDRYFVIESKGLSDCMVSFMVKTFKNNSATLLFNNNTKVSAKSRKRDIKLFKKQLSQSTYCGFNRNFFTNNLKITPYLGFGEKGNRLNGKILEIIRESKKSLLMYTPYFNFPKKITKELGKALKRGVKITIVVGDKQANDFFIPPDREFNKIGLLPYIYEQTLRKFLIRFNSYIEDGCLEFRVWKDGSNSYHLKGLEADKTEILITGHNLNPRAWRLDLENGLHISDPEKSLRRELDREYDDIVANTKKIDSYRDISRVNDYPKSIKKYLKRVTRIKLDYLIKKIL
ncbi:MAG: phosphatidylserine synthase [Candidatus Cloacimonadota bacterium]|nr:MAG: phosphatidylserine synthase [Candidatus Cloacimonadota bacterium]PIE77965.1 MAG: phosphatidylserine synthase [Candidatus Delongbacteria bacterium]